MAGDRFIERSMTDEIMYALMELSGQTYVDLYAASVKAKAAEAAQAGPDGAPPSAGKPPIPSDGEEDGRGSSRLPGTRAS
jgi:1-acyl-sn-glycerol-3-phosphate acyltransferase